MSLEDAFNLFPFSFLKPALTKWLSITVQQRFYCFRARPKICWVIWELQRSSEQALLQDRGKLWFVWELCGTKKTPYLYSTMLTDLLCCRDCLFLWTDFGRYNIHTHLSNNFVYICAFPNSKWIPDGISIVLLNRCFFFLPD